jgi:hypothetical protein
LVDAPLVTAPSSDTVSLETVLPDTGSLGMAVIGIDTSKIRSGDQVWMINFPWLG